MGYFQREANFQVHAAQINRVTMRVVALFVILSVCCQLVDYYIGGPAVWPFYSLFDLDTEQNIPTLFSCLLLLWCSFLLFLVSTIAVSGRFYWRALAVLFAGMGVEEFIGVHEKLSRSADGPLSANGFFHFTWTIPASIFVVLCGIFFARFLLSLPGPLRNGMALAGIIYVSGALSMEMIDGKFASLYGDRNLPYDLMTTLEEGLEMLGSAWLARTLLRVLSANQTAAKVRIF